MLFLLFIFTALTGLVMGSFLTAFTWRIVKGENFMTGRSKCDNCQAKLNWYDNIPLISYFILKGKCRNCSRKISVRYPLIEVSTAFLFVGIFRQSLESGRSGIEIIYLLIIAVLLMAILVIDLEHQIIPDELVFILISLTFIFLLLVNPGLIYPNLLTGFSLALFLLLLHIFTGGKGMGLGDVKLAIFMGLFFGHPVGISWILTSFIIGAVVGIILIINKKASFGKHIAFGPFMVVSYFVNLFWAELLTRIIVPYL